MAIHFFKKLTEPGSLMWKCKFMTFKYIHRIHLLFLKILVHLPWLPPTFFLSPCKPLRNLMNTLLYLQIDSAAFSVDGTSHAPRLAPCTSVPSPPLPLIRSPTGPPYLLHLQLLPSSLKLMSHNFKKETSLLIHLHFWYSDSKRVERRKGTLRCNKRYLGVVHFRKGLSKLLSGKESACQYRRHRRLGFDPCFGKIPWRRKW